MIDISTILKDLTGAAIVVAALLAVAVIIKLIVTAFERRDKKTVGTENVQERAVVTMGTKKELKLINVDEVTAVLIMAIVSHESGIPLPELVFTSIKLI